MRKFDCLAVMVGVVLVGGACSDSYKPTPSASGVFPSEGFIGRKLRVEISGEETKWADGATVSFGDGITVSNVVVASESDILADIDIASTAALMDHDVTVTSGKETDTLKAAFRLKSPIEFKFQGQAAQGSIAQFTVANHDFDNPFDTTSVSTNPFLPPTFTNIQLDAGPGVALQVSDVQPYSISGIALIDVDAPAMTPTLQVISGPAGGTTVTSSLGTAVSIMARTPMMLTADTASTGMETAPYDSALYTFTPGGYPALADLSVTANGPSGGTGIAVLPSSGHFSDLLSAGATSSQVLKSGSLYVIAYDLSGDAAYSYQVLGKSTTLTAVADTEPGNSTSTGATTLTTPALVDNATLADLNDEDWFKVTVPVGKAIHVRTLPGDPGCDTFVDIYGPANATTQYAQGSDSNYHEDLTSPVTTVAGTYYIKISASQAGYFDVSSNHYLAVITLE